MERDSHRQGMKANENLFVRFLVCASLGTPWSRYIICPRHVVSLEEPFFVLKPSMYRVKLKKKRGPKDTTLPQIVQDLCHQTSRC